ncbi:MAG: hypothetical protein GX366_09490 [Epulopiscium sp.]|nr:hypothetical protein [Candidatus Epulonipiscium sp.]
MGEVEFERVMSAAKAPKTDGKGWEYPRKDGMPFDGAFITNGRQTIRNMLSFR